jgi:hypothetical protein
VAVVDYVQVSVNGFAIYKEQVGKQLIDPPCMWNFYTSIVDQLSRLRTSCDCVVRHLQGFQTRLGGTGVGFSPPNPEDRLA